MPPPDQPKANERACCDDGRASNSSSAVHRDSSAFADFVAIPRVRAIASRNSSGPPRSGIGKARRLFHLLAEAFFSLKVEFAEFFGFEEADDDIDTVRSPSGNLVVEPVATTRTGHDRQPPGQRQVDPIDLWAHLGSS